jgi:DNA-binding response OmpR family regulator
MSHFSHLWVIEDTPLEPSMIRYFLSLNFKVIQTPTVKPFLKSIESIAAILISTACIKDDLSLIDSLYQHYHTPILVIGETNGDEDICIRALESGADDFLIKPIHPRELVARISTITRRIHQTNHTPGPSKETLLFEGWRLMPSSRQLFDPHHQEQVLSNKAFDLLLAFLRHPHQILHRDYLSAIAQYQSRNSIDRRIDLQISRLRQQLETGKKTPLIKTIRNKGYLFTADVESVKQFNA